MQNNVKRIRDEAASLSSLDNSVLITLYNSIKVIQAHTATAEYAKNEYIHEVLDDVRKELHKRLEETQYRELLSGSPDCESDDESDKYHPSLLAYPPFLADSSETDDSATIARAHYEAHKRKQATIEKLEAKEKEVTGRKTEQQLKIARLQAELEEAQKVNDALDTQEARLRRTLILSTQRNQRYKEGMENIIKQEEEVLKRLSEEIKTLKGNIASEKTTPEKDNPERNINLQEWEEERNTKIAKKTAIEIRLQKIQRDYSRIEQPKTSLNSAIHWIADTLGFSSAQ